MWTGVISDWPRLESFKVASWEVVRIVDGVGSNGYIEIEVNAWE